MTQAATAAVRKQIVVDAPQDRAFTVFTENSSSTIDTEPVLPSSELP